MSIVTDFIEESNGIEGIWRPALYHEIQEFERFRSLSKLTLEDCNQFVSAYQPGARLRDTFGLDVYVGGHVPPRGGPEIRHYLKDLLMDMANFSPYVNHTRFEWLHPYTDCNGRLGRMIWYWQMGLSKRGFLHEWYYQSLREGGYNYE